MEFQKWNCTYPGCRYSIVVPGVASLKTLKELHLESHEKENRRATAEVAENFLKNKAEFEARLRADAKPKEPLAIAPYTPPPVKDYNKLELTGADRAFLKTRGVKID